MSDLSELVLTRLRQVGFEVRSGWAEPFGERVPLLTGVAWDLKTAQIAFLAEGEGSLEPAAWRQLLFASSGMRHQLAGDEASAFGTPVVIAIVDRDAGGQLQTLAEDLARDYAVFSRVDLNLVSHVDVSRPERLDEALAPLLPHCRRLCGSEISKGEVQQFWALLRGEVEGAAASLDEVFGDRRMRAGRDGADALIGDSPTASELPAPKPINDVRLRRFRSIEKLDLSLAGVNVVSGTNGGGKTSLIEALELAWSGSSQRKPADVDADEYGAHLPLGGEGSFSIEVDGRKTERPAEKALAELSRCVLTQEAMATLASEAPKSRFATLLAVTGLEIPDVKARTEVLVRESKADLDQSFSAAGMSNLERIDRVGLKHLRSELEGGFASRYGGLPDLGSLEDALVEVSNGAFRPRAWRAQPGVTEALDEADRAVAAAEEHLDDAAAGAALDAAREAVAELLDERAEASAAVRRLLEALRAQLRSQRDISSPVEESLVDRSPRPLNVELASRWLKSAAGVQQSADLFRADAEEVSDEGWADRLLVYAAALDAAAQLVPVGELEALSKPQARPSQRVEVEADPSVQRAAGFGEAAIDAAGVGPVLRELGDALDTHVAVLRQISRRLEHHPARNLAVHWDHLMDALCRFELARTLRREGPIQQASERMVSELLGQRLAPVVAELMASIVRFEWYFQPLRMSTQKRQVLLGGLATDRADLDARLLLNSAEKSVLGVAWFLALYMLQPSERRAVLVLDDPTAAFDSVNTAGFTSTLRALTRLLRPEQVVIATHDDRVAALLSEELAPVDGWPSSVKRIRFQRGANLRSTADTEWESERQGDILSELERIGLSEDSTPGVGVTH